ncbi:hypothetical protein V2W30_18470 [Streptomyces sp. Q6]|uniref:Uncharacterized protein n=1 Tax=Streptomyces citrinus TaxID=3118173 RepID=A0ACD5AD13_9ACTN
MILIPEVLATLLGYGLEEFVRSEYGLLGLLALTVCTLTWSAERKSVPWAAVGAVLALLLLAQTS